MKDKSERRDIEAVEKEALENTGPRVANWWPEKGGEDPETPVPVSIPPVRIERREISTDELYRDPPLIAALPDNYDVAQAELRKVQKSARSRGGSKQPKSKRPKATTVLRVTLSVNVAVFSTLTIDQATGLHFGNDWRTLYEMDDVLRYLAKAGVTPTVRLSYPFHVAADVLLEPFTRTAGLNGPRPGHSWKDMSVSSILWQIAQAYAQIYREETAAVRATKQGVWGIWGHSIHDLVFEGLEVDYATGIVRVYIGS